jgi:phenol 2-monooxygenase
LRDYEKLFCAESDGAGDIYAQRGIDRAEGCIVVVRPDQFVANIVPLDGFYELTAFFDRFMIATGVTVPVSG